MTECPKCGYRQDGGEECLRCGVFFTKARAVAPPPPASDPSAYRPRVAASATSRSRAPSLLTWLVAAVALLAAGLWWSGGAGTAPPREPVEVLGTAGDLETPGPPDRPGDLRRGQAGDRAGPSQQEPTAGQARPSRAPLITSRWHQDAEGYRQALALQEETQQPVLVYFHTDWCGYCRQLERELLDHYEVEGYLQEVLKVKINPEHGADERGISRSFGVTGYPSLFAKGYGRRGFRRIQRGIRDGSRVRLQKPTEFVETLRRATGGGRG